MDTKCNLCGSTDLYTLYRKAGKDTGIARTVVKCRKCGLVFVYDRLPQETLAGFYTTAYYNSYKKDYFLLLQSLMSIKEYSKGQTLLDVGCGMGEFLSQAQTAGYRVSGVEFSKEAYERLKGKFDVHLGRFEDINLNRRFDIIVALGVLKHVQDPRSFFEKVKLHLVEGGVFFCITANFDSAISRILRSGWSFIEPDKHLYYFSAATLEKYFKKSGLEPRYLHPYQNKGKRITRFFLKLGWIKNRYPANPVEKFVYVVLGLLERARNIGMPYAVN